jgi:thymidylate kinase
MFIVIEGADGSGKSSLIAAIKSELETKHGGKPIAEFHKGKPEEETRRWVLNEYAMSIEKTDWQNRLAIADRWHWGEVTYAPIKRPHTCNDPYGLLGRAGWRWVELFLASRGVAQFWLYQPLEVLVNRINARGDDFVNTTELHDILLNYELGAAATARLADKITPDPDNIDCLPEIARLMIAKAETIAEKTRGLAEFPEYIGVHNPAALLVGDQRNVTEKYGNETCLPFMPVNSNSGEFLLNNLPSHFWKSFGIVNANEFYGSRLLNLWETLHQPKIIALGRMAEKGLLKSGIKQENIVVFPHPQYVKRFHHHDGRRYGDAICEATQGKVDSRWILR